MPKNEYHDKDKKCSFPSMCTFVVVVVIIVAAAMIVMSYVLFVIFCATVLTI